MTFYAIDVSHHQNPASLDWAGMRAAGCDAAIVRLTYGLMQDKRAAEHIKRARDAGMAIGAYHFSRCSQPLGDQIEAFVTAARLADYGRQEDLIPVLDVEDDTEKRPIDPSHAESFHTMATLLDLAFGHKPYIYITQRDWGRLGKPEWVLRHPLHVAHYAAPSRIEPATPNGYEWEIWQHRVADFDINGPNGYYKDAKLPLDQNRARKLRFLNGQVLSSMVTRDEEFPTERHIEDTERTHERRTRVMNKALAAEAGAIVSDAYFDMLEGSRLATHRELAGLEPEPERHDTEPSPPPSPTEPPPKGEA